MISYMKDVKGKSVLRLQERRNIIVKTVIAYRLPKYEVNMLQCVKPGMVVMFLLHMKDWLRVICSEFLYTKKVLS